MYVHVDLMLASKTMYERRSKELFDDLGLKSESYRHASNRKQLLLKAIKELQGVRLSTRVLRSVTLERTKDNKDYKVVFRKSAANVLGDEMELEIAAPIAEASELQPSSDIVINRYKATDRPGSSQRGDDEFWNS